MDFLQQLIITEANMGLGALEYTASKYAERVEFGFEAEMVIKRESEHHAYHERMHMGPHELENLNDIREYFEFNSQDERVFDRMYNRWFEDHLDDAIEKNWQELIDYDEPDSETAARNETEAAIREHPDKYNLGRDNFIKDVGAEEIINNLKLQPHHGWHAEKGRFYAESGSGHSEYHVRKQAAADLERLLGVQIQIFKSYHEKKKNKTMWYVEPDTSIIPNEGQGGTDLELVSPPMEITDGLARLELVLDWMQEHAYTTDTTGLHLNLSFKNKPKIDWLKLALFMGEEYVLKQFNRINHDYAGHHLRYIMSDLSNGKLTPDVKEFLDSYNTIISRERHHSFNIQDFDKKGYVEFRATGNSGYENRFEDIRRTVLRFVRALVIAADPDAYRKEYLKKVALLISKGLEGEHLDIKINSTNPAPVVALSRLLKLDQHAAVWMQSAPKNWERNKEFAKDQIENSLVRLADVLMAKKIVPTFQERKALRELIRQYQLPMPDPIDHRLTLMFKYAGLIK